MSFLSHYCVNTSNAVLHIQAITAAQRRGEEVETTKKCKRV